VRLKPAGLRGQPSGGGSYLETVIGHDISAGDHIKGFCCRSGPEDAVVDLFHRREKTNRSIKKRPFTFQSGRRPPEKRIREPPQQSSTKSGGERGIWGLSAGKNDFKGEEEGASIECPNCYGKSPLGGRKRGKRGAERKSEFSNSRH